MKHTVITYILKCTHFLKKWPLTSNCCLSMTLPLYSIMSVSGSKSRAARRIFLCFCTRVTRPSCNYTLKKIFFVKTSLVYANLHFTELKVLYLHLRAQHGVVTGQLCAVNGVHSKGCWVWRALGGRVMELEKCLNISTVLIGLSLLILICPLADTRLPAFSRVLIQNTCFTSGVLSE